MRGGGDECTRAVLSETDYPAVELLIVDDGTEPLTNLYNISGNKCVRVLHCKEKGNASAAYNFAAGHAKGELLLFYDRAVRAREPGWLRELVQTLLGEEKIGIAGAKLLYADDTIRHAGITLGLRGVAGGSIRRYSWDEPGYFSIAFLTREVSAVSGACMLVRKSLFEKLHGFDASNLPGNYNDVDLCLRARQAGWKVAINPHACLYHPEQTRGEEPEFIKREKMARRVLLKRYSAGLLADPCYNPNLSITCEMFLYALWPRCGKPWRPWLEVVCPFSPVLILQAMQVCYFAHLQGVRLRLHIPSGYAEWLSDFVTPFPVLGIPQDCVEGEEPARWFYLFCSYVADRPDSSGNLAGVHRSFDLPPREQLSPCLSVLEYMLYKLRLPIDARLFRFCPEGRAIESAVSDFVDGRTVLICPYGSERMNVLPKEIIGQVLNILRQNGWKVIQIGETGQEMLPGFDGYLLVRRSIGWWRTVLDRAGLIIGCDSWLTHLATILDRPQVMFYGTSPCRDCSSKGAFADSKQSALVFDTRAKCAPACNKQVCALGQAACIGFHFDSGSFTEYIRKLQGLDNSASRHRGEKPLKVMWLTTDSSRMVKSEERTTSAPLESALMAYYGKEVQLAIVFEQEYEGQAKLVRGNVCYFPLAARLKKVGECVPFWDESKKKILQVIEEFQPDMIQCFGSEWTYGAIVEETCVPVVIHMMGFLNIYHMAVDMVINSLPMQPVEKNTISKPEKHVPNIVEQANAFELNVMKNNKYFMGRTEWDKKIVKFYSPGAKYYHMPEAMREIIWQARGTWRYHFQGKLRLLTISSADYRKGNEIILRTALILKTVLGLDFEWRVAGSRDFFPFFENRTQLHCRDLNISLLGMIDAGQVREEMQAADFFIHPSIVDNSPRSICEAQLIGCPVIASNVGGIPQLVEDGKTGFLYPYNEPHTLAFIIGSMYKDVARLTMLSKKEVSVASLRHDPRKIAGKLYEIYKKILKQEKNKSVC